MTALDYILDGLEAELALERELGVRLVECDRALLAGCKTVPSAPPLAALQQKRPANAASEGAGGTVGDATVGALGDRALPAAQPVGSALRADRGGQSVVGSALRADRGGQETRDERREAEDLRRETREEKKSSAAVQPPTSNLQPHDFVFLHDKPLSPAGVEMMAKIITAMGTTAEQAPIVFEKPIPRAKVYVVLGGLALRKFQPTLKGAPGQWLETAKGAPVLITYSPEYILRFKEVTPAVKKIKQDMWRSLKGVLQRCRC